MAAINDRQKNFCREYVRNGANAYQAAIAAGYTKRTASHAAAWVTDTAKNRDDREYKPHLREYINELINAAEAEKIASPEEMLQFFTAAGRGEIFDYSVTPSGKVIEVPISATERRKNFETLAKLRGMFNATIQTEERQQDDPLTAALREEAERLENGYF